MIDLIVRRIFWLIPTILAISFISFVIIQLPPGDYLTSYIAALEETGEVVDEEEVQALRERYGLDSPWHIQYLRWLGGISPIGFTHLEDGRLRWWWPFKTPDLGMSFAENRPAGELIAERLPLTILLSLSTLAFTWMVAIPIGIYSAVKQYSPADYTFTFLGFIGLATPNFLLALVFLYAGHTFLDISPGALTTPDAPWWHRVFQLFVPVVIIGTAGTAGMIRVMRGNLLDELKKQYVVTARAKGVPPVRLILKYPARVAINPMVSTIGWVLPGIVSGEAITSIVLNLPTTGPLLLNALLSQDMFLAGSMIMILAVLMVIGTLISDLLLIIVDPRIRYEKRKN